MRTPARLLVLGYGFLVWVVVCDWTKGNYEIDDPISWFRALVMLAMGLTMPLASVGRKTMAPLVGWLFLGMAALFLIAGLVAGKTTDASPAWVIQYWGAILLCVIGAYLWLLDRKVQAYRDVLASVERLPVSRAPKART